MTKRAAPGPRDGGARGKGDGGALFRVLQEKKRSPLSSLHPARSQSGRASPKRRLVLESGMAGAKKEMKEGKRGRRCPEGTKGR